VLWIYLRSVKRSMRARAGASPETPSTGTESAPATPPALPLELVTEGEAAERSSPADAFAKEWRYAGSIRLIAGPDLATSTVEPHEFLDFLSGKLARPFIPGSVMLDQRLAESEPRRDFDLRYRVSDFFCRDDTWKMVLARLAASATLC
jgi:hypothetical protein